MVDDEHSHDEHSDDERSSDEARMGAAVDDALADEVKRQKRRFVQAIIGLDRAEGVGRGEQHWNDELYRDATGEYPTDDGHGDRPAE